MTIYIPTWLIIVAIGVCLVIPLRDGIREIREERRWLKRYKERYGEKRGNDEP